MAKDVKSRIRDVREHQEVTTVNMTESSEVEFARSSAQIEYVRGRETGSLSEAFESFRRKCFSTGGMRVEKLEKVKI